MRKQYFSSLRQGSLLQASLAGSSCLLSLGAFLSFIWLTHYLPYSSASVCLRFWGNRSTGGMRPGRLLIGSTTNESLPVVIPFRCLFCATVDGCYPPETFLDGWTVEQGCSQASLSASLRDCGLFTFWSSPLSCVGLVIVTMGPSHLRPLILLDQ